jgi:hypothetical protein
MARAIKDIAVINKRIQVNKAGWDTPRFTCKLGTEKN